MDFNQVDIPYFLQESIPKRFQEQSPLVFEAFIKYLFEQDGFTVLPVDPTPDMAGMILAEKNDSTHLICPQHRQTQEEIGPEVITKMSAAMEKVTHEHAWVITNASFSEESENLADEAGIELWDWDALYAALSTLFFEKEDPLEAIKKATSPIIPAEVDPYLKMKVKWEAAEGIGKEWYNLGITISNPTDRNVYLHLDLPALIDPKKNQIMADQWGKGEFVAGMLYGGASIRTNALFSVTKLGERPAGGRIVLTCHERSEPPITYHLNARLRGQACYVVTYCYTTDSREYDLMTQYRDQVLSKTIFGRLFIQFYYFTSSRLVKAATHSKLLDSVLRKLGKAVITKIIKRIDFSRHIEKKSNL